MCRELVSTVNLSKEEWLHWRSKGIGGSDASSVCGINPYKSPVELWLEKTGLMEPKEASEAAYWGTVLEPIVRNEFMRQTGLKVEQQSSILQHESIDFMLANLDGVVKNGNESYVFEAKTAGAYQLKEWEAGIPDNYQLQIQHYMAVTDFKGAYIAVLIGGNQFRWYFVERDKDLINMLIQLENAFWQQVVARTPPPIDGSQASSDLLSYLYSNSIPKSQIILPDDAITLIQEYEALAAQEKVVSEKKEEASNKLKSMLQDNEIGLCLDRIISWKSISSERLDSKKLRTDLPDIYEKYAVQSSYRRFSIK